LGLLCQNQLAPWLSLGYEADLIWNDSSRPAVFFGLCLGFDINDKLSVGLEEYNENTTDGTDCWSEISIGWQVTSRVQLDIGSDIYLNHLGRYHNVMLGLAWQITKR